MSSRVLVACFTLALFGALLLAGCAQPTSAAAPTPEVSVAATSTPAAPAAPAAQQATPTPAPTVRLISSPTTATAGVPANFTWGVSTFAPTYIIHTSIHYDNSSHPGVFGLTVTPASSGYPHLVPTYAHGNYSVPANFAGQITFPTAGTWYYRAHAIIGGLNYWTDEYAISVSPAPTPATPTPTPTPSATPYVYPYYGGGGGY